MNEYPEDYYKDNGIPMLPITVREAVFLEKLVVDLPKPPRILEFGCGVSTHIFMRNSAHVFIVENDYERCERFFGQHGVVVLHGSSISEEIKKIFDARKDSIFDMAFIDADHRYQYVRNDIEIAHRLVRPGGIICGHDYDGTTHDERFIAEDCVDHRHHGVIKAVNEYFDRMKKEQETFTGYYDSLWYLKRN